MGMSSACLSPSRSRQRRRLGSQEDDGSSRDDAPDHLEPFVIRNSTLSARTQSPATMANDRTKLMRQRRRRTGFSSPHNGGLAILLTLMGVCVCNWSHVHVLAFVPRLVSPAVSSGHQYRPPKQRHVMWSAASSHTDDDDDSTTPLFVDRTPDISIPTEANDSLQTSFDRVRQTILGGASGSDEATDAATTKKINLAIVERGQQFASSASANGDANSSLEPSLVSDRERVPGCVATVHVQTSLLPLDDTAVKSSDDATNTNLSKYRIVVDGDADALLSRGLLALLSDALSGDGRVTAQDILNLDPDTVADLLGLRTVLSTGRNDGLASMTTVVQNQIRQSLGLSSAKNAESPATAEPSNAPANNGEKRHPTVAMLLSGGVDSSVALNLLVREGYDVTAFYLKIWLEDELSHLGQCPWEDDYSVCQAVCDQAGVPLETVSLQNQYKDRVIFYTVDEARKGRTPNPDIMCNSRVKFGCFYDAIGGRGFDYVASGHYAQLVKGDEDESGQRQMHLLRAPDPVKDQTYFLCALTQEQLSRVEFPIGSFLKSEVRDLAQQFQLPNRNRPDSQGLCFLGKVKFDEFINAYLGTNPGDIVDATTGRVIGRHNGLWYHTVGQRKGIDKVLNPKETAKGPWYIVAKDQEKNIVIASNEYDQEAFEEARSDFYVEDITWVAGSPPERLVQRDGGDKQWKDGRFTMKIRHGPTMVNGTLTLDMTDAGGGSGNVHLDTKDKGLAPGQYCVFYNMDDEECLGAGVISERHWAKLLLETNQAEKLIEKEGEAIIE